MPILIAPLVPGEIMVGLFQRTNKIWSSRTVKFFSVVIGSVHNNSRRREPLATFSSIETVKLVN